MVMFLLALAHGGAIGSLVASACTARTRGEAIWFGSLAVTITAAWAYEIVAGGL